MATAPPPVSPASAGPLATCRCGATAPAVDPVPLGWTRLHVQVSQWTGRGRANNGKDEDAPILEKRSATLALCGKCAELVIAAIATLPPPPARAAAPPAARVVSTKEGS